MTAFLSQTAADPNAGLVQRINDAVDEQLRGWMCQRTPAEPARRGANLPQGRSYVTRCTGGNQSMSIRLFIGQTPQDAVGELELSQKELEVNRSRPMTDVGEQGYVDTGGYGVWITFRQGVVFGHISVGVVPTTAARNVLAEHSSEEWLKIAKQVGLAIVKATTDKSIGRQ